MDQKTEVQLLAELAAAPTQAEQHRIAADLEGLRRTSALRVESSAMWEVDDAPTWQATERPQVLTYATRESDWLATWKSRSWTPRRWTSRCARRPRTGTPTAWAR